MRFYLTCTFSLLLFMQMGIASYGQKVSIVGKNLSFEQVLSSLRKQSDYTFVYKSDVLNKAKTISLQWKDIQFEEALEKILKMQGLSFEKKENTIIIYKKPEVAPFANAPLKTKRRLQQEELTVRGRVFDTHEPPSSLPGVSVSIKGTNQGTTTDPEGYYTISVPKGGILQFSMIGFLTSEQTINRDHKKPYDKLS